MLAIENNKVYMKNKESFSGHILEIAKFEVAK